jgi:hypothetical protein
MLNMNNSSLNFSKASFLMGAWGLLLVLGGIINQWWGLNIDNTLWLWAGVTILGIIAQVAGLMKGLGLNLTAWLGAIVLGWAFTFYAVKGSQPELYGDLPGVWLILLGLGYVATAFQVDKRFFIIAAIQILFGILMELSYRQILAIDFVDRHSIVLFGLVSGLPLIIAALPFWYAKAEKPAAAPHFAMQEN